MRIIIDTHVLIWYLNGDEILPASLIKIIEDSDNVIVISVVSLWELTIKMGAKKLTLDISLNQIQQFIQTKDIELLDINFNSFVSLLDLPYHHRDPFDRMLIAQAISENLTIISADRHFQSYPVNVIW